MMVCVTERSELTRGQLASQLTAAFCHVGMWSTGLDQQQNAGLIFESNRRATVV